MLVLIFMLATSSRYNLNYYKSATEKDVASEIGSRELKCGNLYEISESAARYISQYSKMKLDTETVYALLCDPIYNSLIPESHIEGMLEEVNQHTYISYTHVIKHNGHGYRVEGDVSEVTQVTHNQYIGKYVSLRSYTHGVMKLFAGNLVDLVCYNLTNERYLECKEKLYEELHSNAAIRSLYGSLVSAVEHYGELCDENVNRAMFFILERENLYNALKSHDYNQFLYEMHAAAVKDIFTVKQILLQPMVDSLADTRILYNTLVTCAIAYSQPKNNQLWEHDQFVLDLASKYLSTLFLRSPRLQEKIALMLKKPAEHIYPLTVEDVLTIFTTNGHSFLECLYNDVNIQEVTQNCSITIDAGQNLERIAAATLVLYPGTAIKGDEIILLRKGGPRLLNMGNVKIAPNNPHFKSDDAGPRLYKEYNIADDIRVLFLSIQEASHHLDWDVFIKELRTICAKMRNVKFATETQSAIKRKLSDSLYDSVSLVENLPVVIYESILPRVKDIEAFLQNQQLVDSLGHLTKLVHNPDKDILTTSDFLLLSGYKHGEDASHQQAWLQKNMPFFDKIDSNCEHFAMHFPPNSGADIAKSQGSQPSSHTCENENTYKISELDHKKRKGLVKTLATRSFSSTLKYRLLLPTISAAVVFTLLLVYTMQIMLSPLLTTLAGATYVAALVAIVHVYYRNTPKCQNYVMSVPKCVKNSEFLHLDVKNLYEKPEQHKSNPEREPLLQKTDDAQHEKNETGALPPQTSLLCRVSGVSQNTRDSATLP